MRIVMWWFGLGLGSSKAIYLSIARNARTRWTHGARDGGSTRTGECLRVGELGAEAHDGLLHGFWWPMGYCEGTEEVDVACRIVNVMMMMMAEARPVAVGNRDEQTAQIHDPVAPARRS